MAENFFSQTLRYHLNATRAGLFGQFEHAMNFNTGPDQNAFIKIAPGQNIVFTGILDNVEMTTCTLKVTNNHSGPPSSGRGFRAQTEDPQSPIVVVGPDTAGGQATLEFSCPTGPSTGETLSYTTATTQINKDRFEAISEQNAVIFTKCSERTVDIARSAAGDWYTLGGAQFIPAELTKFDSDGIFIWRGIDDQAIEVVNVAHDSSNKVAAALTRRAPAGSATGRVVGYDSDGPDQGGPSEPPPLWETVVSGPNIAVFDMKSDNAGFFYVAVRKTDEYDGATTGVFKNVLKIDSSTGTIVASFFTGSDFGNLRLAVGPSGEIVVAQTIASVPDGGGATANVFKLDSSLSLLARADVDWQTKLVTVALGPEIAHVAVDETGKIYVCSNNAFGVRFDSGLTTEEFSQFLLDGSGNPIGNTASPGARDIVDMGHNQAGKLILFGGGGRSSVAARVYRYANDLSFLTNPRNASLPASAMVQGHVRAGTGGGPPGPDIGTVFTSELSLNPPGRVQAIAAVKYEDGNIVSIYWNSVEVEFKPLEWSAVHSEEGLINIRPGSPGWEYNSPL